MSKPTQGYSKHDERNVWNQRTDDHKSSDKESDSIYEQMTGAGLISTESGNKDYKNSNFRNNPKYKK